MKSIRKVNENSKFLDLQHIKYQFYNDLTIKSKNKFIEFLNENYLNETICKYKPSDNNIDFYFKNTINPIYTFYTLKMSLKIMLPKE